MFKFVGLSGMLLGALCLVLVKEPKRGRFDDLMKTDEHENSKEKFSFGKLFKDYKNALTSIIENPVSRFVTLGGCFKFTEIFV